MNKKAQKETRKLNPKKAEPSKTQPKRLATKVVAAATRGLKKAARNPLGAIGNATLIYNVCQALVKIDQNHSVIDQLLKGLGVQFMATTRPLHKAATKSIPDMDSLTAIGQITEIMQMYVSVAAAVGMRSANIVGAYESLKSSDGNVFLRNLRGHLLELLKEGHGDLQAVAISIIEYQVLLHVLPEKGFKGKRPKL